MSIVRRRFSPLLPLCVALFAACTGGADASSRDWSTTTHTVGDTVVARTTGVIPDTGTHHLTEVWRVGDVDALDSTITFGGIHAFAVAPDNTVAVFDRTAPTLRLYDADGRYVRTLGRKGAGPGEYTQSNGMAFLPDGRLAFWDPETSRLTLYDREGTGTSTWTPPGMGWFMSNALAPASPHALAVRGTVEDSSSRDIRGMLRRRTAYFLYDDTGRIVDTIMVPPPPVEAPMLVSQNQGSMITWGVPFFPSLVATLLSDGRLAVGYGAEYAIRVLHGGGQLRIEREAVPVRTLPAEHEDRRAEIEFSMRTMNADWRWEGPAIPDVKPLFNAMMPSADGRLWVRLSAPGERIPAAERDDPPPAAPGAPPRPPVRQWREPMWYDVYETGGTFLGRVVLPPRATLLGMRGDLVWGVVRGDLDVPFLVQWRVTPGWGAAAAAR